MGDVSQAGTYAARIEQRLRKRAAAPIQSGAQPTPSTAIPGKPTVRACTAMVFEARGQYAEAEAAYRRAEAFKRAASERPPENGFSAAAGTDRPGRGPVCCWRWRATRRRQGRRAEAEADSPSRPAGTCSNRRANTRRRRLISSMALPAILVEAGRYPGGREARASARSRWSSTLGIGDDAPRDAFHILASSATFSIAQRKAKDAADVYANSTRPSRIGRRRNARPSSSTARASPRFTPPARSTPGLPRPQDLVKRQVARTGANSFDTASAHGTLAVGYARAGRDADAIGEFKLGAAGPDGGDARNRRRRPDAGGGAQRPAATDRRGLYRRARRAAPPCRTTSRSKPSGSPTPSAAMRCSRRWRIRARAWSPRTRRSPNWCAPTRTAPSKSTPSSARSIICSRCRRISATTSTVQAMNAEIDKLRSRAQGGAAGDQQAFPGLRRSDRSEAADGRRDPGGAATRRGAVVVLFRPGQELRLGGAQGRRRRLRVGADDRARARSQRAPAAPGARAASLDHRGNSAVRSRSRLPALFGTAQAGRARLAEREEPDRRDQRRARRIAAQPAADRAGEGRPAGRAAVCRLSQRCRGSHAAMP